MARSNNGAEYTIEFFQKAGVKHFFGIPGHGNVCLFDAVKETESMRLITPKHEQWGGHMADGYFRANRKVPAIVSTSVGPGATNLVGPELDGLDGRHSGSVAGYTYSDANKNSGIVWDEATFKEYIKDPRAKIPGTKMVFAGIKNEQDVNDLWAYLKQFDAEGNIRK